MFSKCVKQNDTYQKRTDEGLKFSYAFKAKQYKNMLASTNPLNL